MSVLISIPKKKRPEKLLANFRVTEAEKLTLQALADRYARGNLTAWLIYAGLNFKPTKEDLTND